VQRGFEQLADDPERKARLELAPTGAQDPQLLLAGGAARGRQQGGLAHPGGGLHDEQTAAAIARIADSCGHLGYFELALEQGIRGRARHARPM
jgi:hypothetical protein